MMRKSCFEPHNRRAQRLRSDVRKKARHALLSLGIDWADQKHDALALDEGERTLAAIHVSHTAEGLRELDSWLRQLQGTADQEQVACISETNHGLLIAFLLEHGWPVYPVNPRTVDRKRSASGAKTDAIDAYLLAKTGRADVADVHRLTPESETVAELKTLTRDQESLIVMPTRLVNQRTACLKDSYPVALQLFAKIQQQSTVLFLQTYPTPDKAMRATSRQIAQTLKEAGPTRAEMASANSVATPQQPPLSAHEVTTRAKSRLMLALVAQLLPLIEQLTAYDKEIERLFLTHEDNEVFSSLPRAGKRLAPRLLAEIGDDPSRSESAASLQALSGTSPVLFQSGNDSKPHRRLGGIKPLQNALHQFAWQSTLKEAWAAAS
jgi:transposase